MSNERPNSGCLVVAPRPVRLSRNTEFNLSSSQNLPTEALEEFLSILKPSFLTMPRSYNFSGGGFDRVSPLKHLTGGSGRFSPVGAMVASSTAIVNGGMGIDTTGMGTGAPCELDGRRSTGAAGPSPHSQFSVDRSACTTPIRAAWFSSAILSSPVSRMQTRNPFARNIDARSPVQIPTRISASPLPIIPNPMSIPPPSPATIPLPVPSPDEMRVLETI